ncbi:MAG: hypothetical protein ACJA2K_002013 [Thalassolituus sp.]|jgi:hypothetical protein
MDLSVQKNKKRKEKKRSQSLEQRFNTAWRRLVKQQQKNEQLQTDVRAFAADIRRRIGAEEQSCNTARYHLIEHLLGFYSRKSLAQWHREILLEWINDHFLELTCNPFSHDLDLASLQKNIGEVVQKVHPEFFAEANHKPNNKSQVDPADAEESVTEDMFADLFAEFEQGDDEDEPDNFDQDSLFEEFFREQQQQEEQEEQERKDISQFLKSSSINKMFRKIAGVLHPDREQDPTQREQKSQLMAELVAAREDNDIPKIFILYNDHVGESPLGQLNDEEELLKVIQLLKHQYEFLRDDEQQILSDNPRDGLIYEYFYRKKQTQLDADLKQHLRFINEARDEYEQFVAQITSLSKLKPILQARYDEDYDDMPFF